MRALLMISLLPPLSRRQYALNSLDDQSVLPPSRTPEERSRLPDLIFPAAHFGHYSTIDPKGPVACFLSHLRAQRLMIDRNETSALFLEDDVDVEFDVRTVSLNICLASCTDLVRCSSSADGPVAVHGSRSLGAANRLGHDVPRLLVVG